MQAIINNAPIVLNTNNNQTTEETINQNTDEKLEQQRKKIFFTPIELNNIQLVDSNDKHSINLNYQPFYDEIKTSDCAELKKILINQVKDFIELENFYCDSRHLLVLNKLMQRIEAEPISNNKYIESRFRLTSYWFHELIILLKKFKQQPEQQHQLATSVTIAISKDAIALRLDTCLVDLDKCWEGIYSRLEHEYEVLTSMEQALPGKINLIKKDLFKAVASEYINKIRGKEKQDILAGNEIHVLATLNNLSVGKLGLNYITDAYEYKNLSEVITGKFIELVTIEISPAKITSILASNIYDKLSVSLVKISMQDWLTTSKKDSDLENNFMPLETVFFAPINLLFNIQEESKKLTINSIIDIIDNGDQTEYSLSRSKEKIFYWVASCLMPNTEKILVDNISSRRTNDYLSIASIDNMFFWVFKPPYSCDNSSKKCEYEADNHITLKLKHIQQLNFINFTDKNITEHQYLSDDSKKIKVSIALVTQAMEQTNDAKDIVNFFTDNNVDTQLKRAPLLQEKLNDILKNKLCNSSFKQQFITAILNKKPKINIDKFLDYFDIDYLTDVSIDDLKALINTNNIQRLFTKALNNASCELIYKLLATGNCDDYINFNAKNKHGYSPLGLALKNNHEKVVKECIKIILASKISDTQKLESIEAKDNSGTPGLYIALENGHTTAIKQYIELILDCDEFTIAQKLKIISAKNRYGKFWLSIEFIYGHDATAMKQYIELILANDKLFSDKLFSDTQKLEFIQVNEDGRPILATALLIMSNATAIKEYIELILASDRFTSEQKLKIIEAKDKKGTPGLYMALQYGNSKAMKQYIELILASDKFDLQQKLEIISAKDINDSPGLSIAFINGYAAAIKQYIELILNYQQFNLQQKIQLCNEVENWNDYANIVNNSNLTTIEKEKLLGNIII